MVDVAPVDCSTLDTQQIMRKMKDIIQSLDPKEKIIRIRLENIPSHIHRGIDYIQLRDLGKTAVHCEIKSSAMKTDESTRSEEHSMRSLADEYKKFLATQHFPEKDILLKLGLEYIHKIEEQDDIP